MWSRVAGGFNHPQNDAFYYINHVIFTTFVKLLYLNLFKNYFKIQAIGQNDFFQSNWTYSNGKLSKQAKGPDMKVHSRHIWAQNQQFLRYVHITWYGCPWGPPGHFGIPRSFHGKFFWRIFHF